jgi:hypothetical protein
MLACSKLLLHAINAALASEAAVANTAAVAGLASALTSLVKHAVQFTKAAGSMQGQQHPGHTAAVHFPAVLATIATQLMSTFNVQLASKVHGVQGAAADNAHSIDRQAAAGAALLTVVFARSNVQLADAMEAAGPQLYFESLAAKPAFNTCLAANGRMLVQQIVPAGRHEHLRADVQWRVWQRQVLRSSQCLCMALSGLRSTPAAAAAAAATPSSGGSSAASAGAAGSSSSSIAAGASETASSSSGQQVKWGYLLRLQQHSLQWAAAVADFYAIAHTEEHACCLELGVAEVLDGHPHVHALAQRYADTLGICRALAAAAPLSVVCNNPECQNLQGLSEAAASCKACAGCKCRYCSAACQTADWKRHKRACRLMVAAGEVCM